MNKLYGLMDTYQLSPVILDYVRDGFMSLEQKCMSMRLGAEYCTSDDNVKVRHLLERSESERNIQ